MHQGMFTLILLRFALGIENKGQLNLNLKTWTEVKVHIQSKQDPRDRNY